MKKRFIARCPEDHSDFVRRGPERKLWVDTLRGLAIFFVIFGHALSDEAPNSILYYVVTSPIKIPLFFAITGYLFRDRDGNYAIFYKNVLLKLVVPWFFLSLIWMKLLIVPLKGSFTYFSDRLMNMITGRDYWFMPACIVAEIIQFYIRKFWKRSWQISIACIICFFVGIIMVHFDICNFAMVNRAFIAQIYMLIGFIFKNYEELFCKTKWQYIVCGSVVYLSMVVITVVLYPGKILDVHTNEYYNLPLCIAMIYLGCFLLFILARKLELALGLFVFIGQNSLIYYMMSGCVAFPFNKLSILLGRSGWYNTWSFAFLKTGWTCMACMVIVLFINRYLPIAGGKR